MANLPLYWGQATTHLAACDGVLAKIIANYPQVKLRLRKDPFTTLARAIVGQQISVKAADAIWARIVHTLGASNTKIEFSKLLAEDAVRLKACGLSDKKVEYLRDLAQHFFDGKILPRRLARQSDSEVKAQLIAVRGIGPWTADMYLMFNLWRPDILPLGDVGLLRAIDLNYSKGKKTSARAFSRVTSAWAPYSTVAVWYMWRSLDPYPVEY